MKDIQRTRVELRIALLQRGFTMRGLARHLGYDPDVPVKVVSR